MFTGWSLPVPTMSQHFWSLGFSDNCLQCRRHKIRCGCEPPLPCIRCRERSQECVWPKEDRRTTRFQSASSSAPPPINRDELEREINGGSGDTPFSPPSRASSIPHQEEFGGFEPSSQATLSTQNGSQDALHLWPSLPGSSIDNGWLQSLFGNAIFPPFPANGMDMTVAQGTPHLSFVHAHRYQSMLLARSTCWTWHLPDPRTTMSVSKNATACRQHQALILSRKAWLSDL